jgi:UDP-glucuronate decarboxylase
VSFDDKPTLRILVAGGAGFVGSHLCRALLDSGHQVVCVDNMLTGQDLNISDLRDNPRFRFMRHDIVDPFNLEVDRIYNLACAGSPVQYQADPIHTLRTNVHGAFNLLELANRSGTRILQASTSEIYGDPEVHPQPESYWGRVNPIGVRSCYDEGKRCAETLFFDFKRRYGLDARIVRIFNTYGPGMSPNDGRVISNFICQALSDQNITIYGDGTQTRSFQYIDDLVRGIILMMENTENFCGPVNLGNPEEYSMLSLAQKIKGLIPESKSELVFKPLPADDPRFRRPDIRLAKESLDWSPKTTLDMGLIKTIDYFKYCRN